MPVLRGLFCYYLFLFCFLGGVVFCTCGLLFFFFLVSPHPVFVIQLVLVLLEMRNTDIVVTTVKGQFMGPKASYRALLL